MALYYNITGSTGVDIELIAPEANPGVIRSIMITNVHATADATVSLYFNHNTDNKSYHIIHTIAVPADSSLLLDNSSVLTFEGNEGYGLYMTVGSSDTVDVLINR